MTLQIPKIPLSTGNALPIIGLGTWLLKDEACTEVIKMALDIGYRHFDTAHYYENHAAIGKGLKGFDRKELFLTSKFSLEQLKSESVEASCDRALHDLKTDYLDLYLLHFPDRQFDMAAILKEALQLVHKQKIHALGVSNFTYRHLQDLLDQGVSPIAVNQVEFHPYLNQRRLLEFCRTHEIHLTSYRSLGKGALLSDPLFEKIGKKHGKTAAQILLRWLIEQQISVIPKASSKKHLEENLALFDFSLSSEDHALLDHFTQERRLCNTALDFDYL